MLYLLTQHLLFNRKYKRFLLCSCNQGAGVIDSGHKCGIILYDDQIKLWEQSLRRWNYKKERDNEYKYFEHMDLVRKKN